MILYINNGLRARRFISTPALNNPKVHKVKPEKIERK